MKELLELGEVTLIEAILWANGINPEIEINGVSAFGKLEATVLAAVEEIEDAIEESRRNEKRGLYPDREDVSN